MQQALDYVRRLFIRIRLHQIFRLVQLYLLHLELAEVEPCDRLASAFPCTHTLAPVFLVLLNESQRLASICTNALHAKCGKQAERNHSDAVLQSYQGS